jgi:hypothetical protein
MDTSFEIKIVTREEANDMMKRFQTKTLSNELRETFKCDDIAIAKFQAWMSTQTRLHDGCIEFTYIPCSMGIIIHATNSLTSSHIDLTDYSK